MLRRRALTAAACLAAPEPVRTRAQTRARRIGAIYPGVDPGGPPPGAAAAWKRLGWILGETLLIERRYASWRMERMPELVDDLLRRQGTEVLVTFGVETAVAAARATRSVPIVFVFAYLPIEGGLIDSYARPGRNATGLAIQSLGQLDGGFVAVLGRIAARLLRHLEGRGHPNGSPKLGDGRPSPARCEPGRDPGRTAHTLRTGAELEGDARAWAQGAAERGFACRSDDRMTLRVMPRPTGACDRVMDQ